MISLLLLLTACANGSNEISEGDIFLPQTKRIEYSNGNDTRTIKYTYDEYGNITSENTYTVEAFFFFPYKHHLVEESMTHTYDENNNIIKTLSVRSYYQPPMAITGDGDSRSEYGRLFKYNEDGLLAAEGYYNVSKGEESYTTEYSYEYDENGNMTAKYHHGIGTTPSAIYTYDEQNRLIREDNPQYHRTFKEYYYDEDSGKLYRAVFTSMYAGELGKNEPEIVSSTSETIYNYDKYGRLTTEVTVSRDGNGKVLSTKTVTYSDFVKIGGKINENNA